MKNEQGFSHYGIDTPEGMERAKNWTRDMILASLKDTGVWAVPRSDAIYRINQIEKTVVREGGEDTSVEKVFEKLGLRVFESPQAYCIVKDKIRCLRGEEPNVREFLDLETLTRELNHFLSVRGISHNDYTAEQLLGALKWSPEDEAWLNTFCDRWHITANVAEHAKKGGTPAETGSDLPL
ncbi:MAG: hypothetical protein M3R16_03620 [Pseudomonadota bacterium]|nr:hypothetical protein [Pseudomonadota bacterium]